MVEAGASIDGLRSSRGWSARDGVVAAVSVDTGKVLDVVYLLNIYPNSLGSPSCIILNKAEWDVVAKEQIYPPL